MNPDDVERLLDDIDDLREPDADPDLEALKTAILIEDTFGITLADNDIGPKLLDRAGIVRLLGRARSPS